MENEENPVYTITGKIEEVTEKEKTSKPGEYFKKIKIQGMTFNVFDTKWNDFLHMGEIIKASYNKTVRGDYTYKNIFFIIKATEEDMAAVANRPAPAQATTQSNTSATSTQPVDWDAKDKRIVKQNVLNRAVEMYLAGKIEKVDILKTADGFLDWVYDKIPQLNEIQPAKKVEEITIEEENIE